jgi:hypothetical protein
MDTNKLLKKASIFYKCAQQITQSTIEEAIYNAGLSPWSQNPKSSTSSVGDVEIKYDAPFFTDYVNPALDETGVSKVSITVNPDGSLAVSTAPSGQEGAFLATPTMKNYAAKVKPLAVSGSNPARLIQDYG